MKKDQLTKQDLQLLCDLVQDGLLSNLNSKSGVKNQAWNDDLTSVQDKLWNLMDWADV
jgi:hypothetical protein